MGEYMGSRSKILVMGGRLHLVVITPSVLLFTSALAEKTAEAENTQRTGRAFSLFSIVQFPNEGCTTSSSSTTYGTCYTATECSTKGGSADGNCAAGFGVCCLITTSTCGATVATNTGYHMYAEVGATSTDTATVTVTYGSTTTAKTWSVLVRQISCTSTWKAPTDCAQYYTGVTGTITSYNFAGGQLLNSQYYNNCIRTEKGYCKIQYKASTGTSPDAFSLK